MKDSIYITKFVKNSHYKNEDYETNLASRIYLKPDEVPKPTDYNDLNEAIDI